MTEQSPLLYGIQFDLEKDVSHWKTPYAWMNYANRWYLIKYRTPVCLVKLFPFLMNYVKHDAWEVTEKIVLENSKFRGPEVDVLGNLESGKRDAKKVSDKRSVATMMAVIGGPIFVELLRNLAGHILSRNDRPSYLDLVVISTTSFFLIMFFTFLVSLIFKSRITKVIEPWTTLRKEIDEIKRKSEKVRVKIKFPFSSKALFIWAMRIMFLGLLFWVIELLPPNAYSLSTYSSDLDSSSAKIVSGAILAITTLLFICPAMLMPIFPLRWRNVKVRIDRIE
ncbi:hypothetical protein ESZ50_07410 [Weissella muntiaci]|uniref:Uncharacterized protein n=1 Tax=Weissella muntiaci TaxID=2508881 RepID=A0A6C2C6T9_9LACO|nr:hypothetical protein [Weissella muntiaci]TYC49065.1 hypothetical protein ESZ50_07410 [Weissella muntiaci]